MLGHTNTTTQLEFAFEKVCNNLGPLSLIVGAERYFLAVSGEVRTMSFVVVHAICHKLHNPHVELLKISFESKRSCFIRSKREEWWKE